MHSRKGRVSTVLIRKMAGTRTARKLPSHQSRLHTSSSHRDSPEDLTDFSSRTVPSAQVSSHFHQFSSCHRIAACFNSLHLALIQALERFLLHLARVVASA